MKYLFLATILALLSAPIKAQNSKSLTVVKPLDSIVSITNQSVENRVSDMPVLGRHSPDYNMPILIPLDIYLYNMPGLPETHSALNYSELLWIPNLKKNAELQGGKAEQDESNPKD